MSNVPAGMRLEWSEVEGVTRLEIRWILSPLVLGSHKLPGQTEDWLFELMRKDLGLRAHLRELAEQKVAARENTFGERSEWFGMLHALNAFDREDEKDRAEAMENGAKKQATP